MLIYMSELYMTGVDAIMHVAAPLPNPATSPRTILDVRRHQVVLHRNFWQLTLTVYDVDGHCRNAQCSSTSCQDEN
jgi:hypothetical protein